MTTRDMENATKKIIVEFAKTIELFDLNPLEARLFAYMYLTGKTMTLDEMSEALGKSKTSMSTSIRALADLNLVSRVWVKGVRKDVYEANAQLFNLFISSYTNKWIDALVHQQTVLKQIKDDYSKIETPVNLHSYANFSERLDYIIEFHQHVADFFKEMKEG
ncbi:GbsR/MarR family transcriptional regulator [Virgibacillus halophilus]|uniref:HTH-type transcriptional regulator n=1 Tax=Tigheibacillus halophilus TaxID=361280 RepID=A0ABU5C9N5_9BACI|nr:transcriptional regulator [Virgibacillus halophilus]